MLVASLRREIGRYRGQRSNSNERQFQCDTDCRLCEPPIGLDRGRIAADADIDSLTLSLVGGGHLMFADRDPDPPSESAVGTLVTSVLADAVRRRDNR